MLFLKSIDFAPSVDIEKVSERVARLQDKFIEYKIVRKNGVVRAKKTYSSSGSQDDQIVEQNRIGLQDHMDDSSNPNEPPSETGTALVGDLVTPQENSLRINPNPADELAEVMVEQAGDIESITITTSAKPSPQTPLSYGINATFVKDPAKSINADKRQHHNDNLSKR